MTPAELTALWLSLKVAATAVVCALPFAFLLAWTVARTRFPGRMLIDGLVHLPLVLPPVVIGYLLLVLFGLNGPVGAWLHQLFGWRFVFSWTGAALAAGLITLPFQVRAIRLALDLIDSEIEDAAASLGASPLDRLFTIILPLAAPGLIGGAITAFAAALGEFGAIITFVSNVPGETQTLPLAIYSALQSPGGEAAAARLAGLSILLALTGLIAAEVATHRLRRMTGR